MQCAEELYRATPVDDAEYCLEEALPDGEFCAAHADMDDYYFDDDDFYADEFYYDDYY